MGVAVLIVLFLNQKPLEVTGFTGYDNGRKKVDIELRNTGSSNVKITEIIVDNGTVEEAQLILSYTLQLVGGGIDSNPWAKFVEIDDEPIQPRILPDELENLEYPHTTPIYYGVRIVSNNDIETVRIKYKYKGVSFVKIVNLNTWPS